MPWNFPEYEWLNGIKAINTRVELPMWSTAELLKSFVRRPKMSISSVKTSYKSTDFRDVVADMIATDWLEKKFQNIDADKLISLISQEIPVDGEEIFEWMHQAFAANSAISVMSDNYSLSGGVTVGACDDAYIPGVQVQDISYVNEPASEISDRGYAQIRSPYGTDRLPILSKLSLIKTKMLAWAANTFLGLKQWNGVLIKWLKVAASPIRKAHIANIRVGGLSCPVFLAHIPPRFGLKNVVRIDIASDKNQTINMTFRDVRDFNNAYGTLRIPLRENSVARVKFKLRSFYGIPPMLVHFESPDNGLVDVQTYEVKSSLIPI